MGITLQSTNTRTTSYLPWEQAKTLIRELENEGRGNTALLCAAGIYFGLRIGDLLKLTWGQIRQSTFHAREGKTGKVRHVEVHHEFAGVRDRYLATFYSHAQPHDDQPVFISQGTRRNRSKAITVAAANARFKSALKRHGIETANASTHTLRKTFSRRIWEKNGKSEASLVLLSDILNHASIAVTRRYLGITGEEIGAAYLSL